MNPDHITTPTERNALQGVQAKKPQAAAYIPTMAERQAARARHRANRARALDLVVAGAVVLPLAGKRPLAASYQRLDADMSAERQAEALDAWRAAKPGREDAFPSHGIGSTRTPERLRAWPHVNDELAFGLSLGPMGVQVVDSDDAEGAAFLAFLAEHGEPLDLARTPATISPGRNGRHFYFANPEGNGGRKLPGLSLDLKAHGGQVVAPGQTLPPKFDEDGQFIPARTYVPVPGSLDLATALRHGTLPPLPACLVRYMVENPGSSGGSATDGEAIAAAMDALAAGPAGDKPERDVAAMVDVLCGESPAFEKLWTEGNPKGDRSAARIALANRLLARYGSAGLDVHDLGEAFALAGEQIAGEPRDRDVAREYGKAVRAGNVGASTGEAFGAVEGEGSADAAALDAAMADIMGMGVDELRERDGRQQLDALVAKHSAAAVEDDGPLPAKIQAIRDEQIARKNRRPTYDAAITLAGIAPTVYLVDGLVVVCEVIVAAGAPGAGKSADLLHLGRCVASGRPYHGRETERGGVLFCSSENPAEDERRTVAHRQRYGDEPGLPFAVERSALSLYQVDGKATADEAYIIASARRMLADTGHACRLIILDNARRVIAPGDTSKEPDTVQLMKAVERIRNATGAAVILIAHTVRDGTRYAGSGAIESSADSVWHYEAAVLAGATRRAAGKDVKLKAAPAYIRFDKMRTGDRNQRIDYALPVEVIGQDSKGRPVNVVVSADLPRSSTAGGASDGSAFGGVDDEDEADSPASLGELPDAAEPQAEPEPAQDERLAVVLEIAREIGAGGAKVMRAEVEVRLAPRLRKRKLPSIGGTKLREMLAELVEDGHLTRSKEGGRLAGFHLPAEPAE